MRTLEEIKDEAVKVMTAKRTAERKIVRCRERLCELRNEEAEFLRSKKLHGTNSQSEFFPIEVTKR